MDICREKYPQWIFSAKAAASLAARDKMVNKWVTEPGVFFMEAMCPCSCKLLQFDCRPFKCECRNVVTKIMCSNIIVTFCSIV